MKVSQKVNKIFAPLWQNDSRYNILMGGRGAGRSTAGSQYGMSRLIEPKFFRCALMRAIYSDIRHSLWQEIEDRIDEQKITDALKITENDMKIEYGENMIKAHGFRASSGSRTAKLKSLASYNTIIIEEAEEVGEEEFRVLDDTLRTVKGNIRIVLLLNPPPKNHWIVKKWFNLEESDVDGFFIPKPKGNITFVGGTFRDNIANLDYQTMERYEEYKDIKPEYYYQMIKGLVPEVVRGKIYNGWKLIDRIPDEARLVRFGIDFGWFPHPAGVVAIYYLDGGYIIDEVAYGTKLSNEHLAGEIKKVTGWDNTLTIADCAEPKSIDEIRGYGVNIEGSEKGKDSVGYGIKVVSEKKISVTRRSKKLWEEYENYAWVEDKDGNPKGVPTENYSHLMDAIRYAIMSILKRPTDPRTESDILQTRIQREMAKRDTGL